jgi:nucleotide-binding universal stress UspA family protein
MYDRILVPVDGSPTSDKGLTEAIALARLTGGRIKLLHVFEPPFLAIGSESALMRGEDIYNVARDAGEHVLARASAQVNASGVEAAQVLLESEGRRLCDLVTETALAWGASLIVLGSHGRRGLQRMLLGSDAEQILRTAPVPVLLVRDTDPRTA